MLDCTIILVEIMVISTNVIRFSSVCFYFSIVYYDIFGCQYIILSANLFL